MVDYSRCLIVTVEQHVIADIVGEHRSALRDGKGELISIASAAGSGNFVRSDSGKFVRSSKGDSK